MSYKVAMLCVICTLIGTVSSNAFARPRKGFHSGPYLTLEAGIMQADFDYDEVEASGVGRRFEPSFGFLFGWNIWDFFSAELQCRYTTNLDKGRREHIVGTNLYGKYTFIADPLTDFESLRILPFVKGGVSTVVLALPGATGSSKNTVASFGIGPSAGAGVAFIWQKYLYFGIDIQEDMLFFDDIRQTVNDVPATLVYKGGFHPSFGAMVILGVHY